MKILHLLRHAKATDDRGVADRDRALTDRGIRAATIMGLYIKQKEIVFDAVLCSTAKRTAQTLDALKPYLPASQKIVMQDALYHAEPSQIAEIISAMNDLHKSVLVIGHNPGLQILASELAKMGDEDAIDALCSGFPTSAFASVKLPLAQWADFKSGSVKGELLRYITPSDLI